MLRFLWVHKLLQRTHQLVMLRTASAHEKMQRKQRCGCANTARHTLAFAQLLCLSLVVCGAFWNLVLLSCSWAEWRPVGALRLQPHEERHVSG